MQTNSSGVYVIPSTLNGKTVVSIGASAFAYENSLNAISLPDTVSAIGDAAFRNCTNLSAFIISSHVRTVGTNAFAACSKLSDVYIASANTAFGNYPFPTIYNRNGNLTIHAPESMKNTVLYEWDADFSVWNGNL